MKETGRREINLSIEKLFCFLIEKHSEKISSLKNFFLNRETCFTNNRAV